MDPTNEPILAEIDDMRRDGFSVPQIIQFLKKGKELHCANATAVLVRHGILDLQPESQER
jgi:hypothetical protein